MAGLGAREPAAVADVPAGRATAAAAVLDGWRSGVRGICSDKFGVGPREEDEDAVAVVEEGSVKLMYGSATRDIEGELEIGGRGFS